MDTPSPDGWTLISAHLDQVLDMNEQERAAWLVSLDEQNPSLAAEIKALLADHRALRAERFLEARAVPIPGGMVRARDTIGAYTLLSPIGHGGMGVVWLAERSDGRFDRQAALKFLSIALAGRGEERFRREGRLLARLTHPHIAQLVDAGVSTNGQPYLVLEYVDGVAIDRFADEHDLDVDARVRLFLDVLSAVAHAHAHLIVHRDIKPSNVFVDRDGQVKLLDFGIAKLLDDESVPGDATLMTRDGAAAMTPEFAAPEQLTGAPITTATDVYALGVLLYVLLSGEHPIGGAGRSAADLVRAIVDVEPRRMSQVAPGTRRRALEGDLDTIVAKALKKNADERYSSVTALADDLQRYLRDEPIRARRDRLTYRAAKFARRNRLPVAAVALTMVALSIGILAANRERLLAERRFGQLRQLSSNVFALDKTIRDLPGSTQARRDLVSASLEYLEGLASAAGNDLDLAQELSQGFLRIATIQGVPTGLSLGDHRAAEESLTKADGFIEMVLASRPRDRDALLQSVTIAADRMVVADSEHRRADADRHARKAAARLDAFLSAGTVTTADERQAGIFSNNIALSFLNSHLYTDALYYARRAQQFARSSGSSGMLAQALSLEASALRYQGELDAALTTIREAREVALRETYPNDTLKSLNTYGPLLREGMILGEDGDISLGRPAEAVPVLQQALDLMEALALKDVNDATSRSRVGTTARELGNILRHTDPERALAVYDLGIARLAEVHNATAQRDRAVLLANSSYPLRALARVPDAQNRIDAALEILKRTRDYPSAKVSLDGEIYQVLRAESDHDMDVGRLDQALTTSETLLQQVMAAAPDTTNDLREATKLSLFYEALAGMYRRSGNSTQTALFVDKRIDLWRQWAERRPRNQFISVQLSRAASAR